MPLSGEKKKRYQRQYMRKWRKDVRAYETYRSILEGSNEEATMPRYNENLSPKQRLFVKEYLKDLNGTQAAIRAGYSEKTANEIAAQNLAKISVRKALDQEMKKREDRTEITVDWVLKSLQEVAERCLQRVPVLDSEGNPTGEYTFNSAGANRALELIGKHLGMYRDVVENRRQGFQLIIHEPEKIICAREQG